MGQPQLMHLRVAGDPARLFYLPRPVDMALIGVAQYLEHHPRVGDGITVFKVLANKDNENKGKTV